MFEKSNNVREIYPDSKFGVLIMKNVCNTCTSEEFNKMKNEVMVYMRENNKQYERIWKAIENLKHSFDFYT